MWALAAVSPELEKMGRLLFIALLLAALVVILVRLWLAVNRESRRARQESMVSLASLLAAPDKSTRLYALKLLAGFPVSELAVVDSSLQNLLDDAEPEIRAAAGRLLALLHPPSQLLKKLSGKDTAEKLEAIARLATLEEERALAALLETAAREPEEKVRQAAVAALSRAETKATFPYLLRAAASGDPLLRAAAKEALRASGTRALGPLLAALRGPGKTTRATAAQLIGELRLREGTEMLIAALNDPADAVREAAASALGKLQTGGAAALSALERALADPAESVREAAAEALATAGDARALLPILQYSRRYCARARPTPGLVQFLGRNRPMDAAACRAWQVLLEEGSEAFFAGLARGLEATPETLETEWLEGGRELAEEVQKTRLAILVKLAQNGLRGPFQREMRARAPAQAARRARVARIFGEAAVPELAEEIAVLLTDPAAEVRREAVRAAGRIAHFAAVDGLCGALSDPEADIRQEAARALRHLISAVYRPETMPQDAGRRLLEEAGAALLQAINDPVEGVRIEIAKALGAAKVAAAIPSLCAWALGEIADDLRKAAGAALLEMPAEDTLPLLAEALSYDDEEVRRRAAEWLGQLGHSGAVAHLVRSFNDSAESVRRAVARALWEVGTAGQCEALSVHLQSPDPRIRAGIAGLLGKVRATEGFNVLAEALSDPNEFVRAAAVNALARFGTAARPHLAKLIEKLDDTDAFVRARAVRAVMVVGEGTPEANAALQKGARDADTKVAAEALGCMIDLAARGGLEPLAEAVADKEVRAAVAEALQAAEAGQLRRLLEAVRRSRGTIQVTLLGLLAETFKTIGTVEEYREDLKSVETEVRLSALEALSLLETEEAIAAVIEVLASDPAASVRKRAAMILGKARHAKAQRALRQAAAKDPDAEVKETARLQVRLVSKEKKPE